MAITWKYRMPLPATGPVRVLKAQYNLMFRAIRELQDNCESGVAGLPAGGLTGEVLQKTSSADGDVEWGPVRAL